MFGKLIRLTDKNRIGIYDCMILISIAILVFSYVFSSVSYREVDSIFMAFLVNVRYAMVVLLLLLTIIGFVIEKTGVKEILIIALLLMYVALVMYLFNSYPISHVHNQLLVYLLAVIACRNIEYLKVLKFMFIVLFCSIIIVFLLALCGFSTFYINYKPRYSSFRLRYSIGLHPNTIAYICFYLVLGYAYIRSSKLTICELILLFVINCLLFYILNTRSIFALTNLFLIIVICYHFYPNISLILKRIKIFVIILPTLLLVLSYFLSYYYDSGIKWMFRLNEMLNGRLGLANFALSEYKISLFGSGIMYNTYGYLENTNNNTYVDMSLLNLLIRYGLITMIILLLLFSMFAYQMYIKNDYLLIIVFIFSFIFTTFNDDLFTISTNYFLFIWSYFNSKEPARSKLT